MINTMMIRSIHELRAIVVVFIMMMVQDVVVAAFRVLHVIVISVVVFVELIVEVIVLFFPRLATSGCECKEACNHVPHSTTISITATATSSSGTTTSSSGCSDYPIDHPLRLHQPELVQLQQPIVGIPDRVRQIIAGSASASAINSSAIASGGNPCCLNTTTYTYTCTSFSTRPTDNSFSTSLVIPTRSTHGSLQSVQQASKGSYRSVDGALGGCRRLRQLGVRVLVDADLPRVVGPAALGLGW